MIIQWAAATRHDGTTKVMLLGPHIHHPWLPHKTQALTLRSSKPAVNRYIAHSLQLCIIYQEVLKAVSRTAISSNITNPEPITSFSTAVIKYLNQGSLRAKCLFALWFQRVRVHVGRAKTWLHGQQAEGSDPELQARAEDAQTRNSERLLNPKACSQVTQFPQQSHTSEASSNSATN